MMKILLGSFFLLSLITFGCGTSEGPSLVPSSPDQGGSPEGGASGPFSLTNGQAAKVVIGQTSFTADVDATTQSGMSSPWDVAVGSNGIVYVADQSNSRVLGFNSTPTAPGALADFVVGKADFVTNSQSSAANGMSYLESIETGGGKLFIGDRPNNRVVIYDPLPTTTQPNASVVIGNSTTSGAGGGGCTQNEVYRPQGIAYGGGKLTVASEGNRVLIYQSVPTTSGANADLVLGQPNFTTCDAPGATAANTLSRPRSGWTDGTRFAIADYNANRVLLWNTFPTTNQQPADIVLGQPDMTSSTQNNGGVSASTLSAPEDVGFNGFQFFVMDTGNNRVLVWNSWPTSNGQAANVVLGQPDFTSSTAGNPLAANTLGFPTGLGWSATQLFVADSGNNRVLVY